VRLLTYWQLVQSRRRLTGNSGGLARVPAVVAQDRAMVVEL